MPKSYQKIFLILSKFRNAGLDQGLAEVVEKRETHICAVVLAFKLNLHVLMHKVTF